MGRKPMADSTSHLLVAVVMRVWEEGLEYLVARVERQPREALDGALGRAIDVAGLTHVEQLETRVFPDYEELIQKTLADAVCLDTSRSEGG